MRNTTANPQVIRADESYTIAEFRRRAGIGDAAFRQVRRDGLRVIPVGKRRYIRGADWHAFLEAKAATQTEVSVP